MSSQTVRSTPVSGLSLPTFLAIRSLTYSLARWTRDKSLSFVPPDGRFTLFDYRFSPTATATTPAGKDNIPIPFVVKPHIDLGDFGGAFPSRPSSDLDLTTIWTQGRLT
jgi:hypothetical protein